MPQKPSDPAVPQALSDEALRWIVQLNSGDATRADHQAFTAWRAAAPENERAACEAEGIWGDASGLSEDRETGSLRLADSSKVPSRRKLLGVAALVAAGGVGGWQALGGNSVFADYATGRGETREAALPDGSRIILDARSAVDVGARQANLIAGEALFEVARDASRPFRIAAGTLRIVADDAAAFTVDVGLPGGGATLAVLERSVRLSTLSASSFELSAPTMVEVDGSGAVGPASPVDRDAATAWRRGRLVAENRRLDDVAGRLGRYHRGWILVRDEVAALRVSAVLDLRTPDASLDALAVALPISVTRLSPFFTMIGRA